MINLIDTSKWCSFETNLTCGSTYWNIIKVTATNSLRQPSGASPVMLKKETVITIETTAFILKLLYLKAIIFESYYIWKLMYLKALLLHLKARLPEFSIAYTYTYENRPKSLNALYNYPTMHRFVKKYVHTCAQFCFKLVYCGIWDWGTVGFVRPVWLLYTQLHSGSLHVFYWM